MIEQQNRNHSPTGDYYLNINMVKQNDIKPTTLETKSNKYSNSISKFEKIRSKKSNFETGGIKTVGVTSNGWFLGDLENSRMVNKKSKNPIIIQDENFLQIPETQIDSVFTNNPYNDNF